MSTQQEKFKAIADNIRTKLGTTELIKPNDFADKITEVYHKGRQDEYDYFWNNYQSNGSRTNYVRAYEGIGWIPNTFKPKYPMRVTNGLEMFQSSRCKVDLVEHLKYLEKDGQPSLDFSTNKYYANLMFADSYFTRIGTVDVSHVVDSAKRLFWNAQYLKQVDKLKISGQHLYEAFYNCTALEHIIIDGDFCSDIDMHWSPLNGESIISVMQAFGMNSGKTLTLSRQQVEKISSTADYEWTMAYSTALDCLISEGGKLSLL